MASLRRKPLSTAIASTGRCCKRLMARPTPFRIAGLTNPAIAAQFHAMASARNLSEFETALKRMQLPMV